MFAGKSKHETFQRMRSARAKRVRLSRFWGTTFTHFNYTYEQQM